MNKHRLTGLLLAGFVLVLLSAVACSGSDRGSTPVTASKSGAPTRVVIGLGHSLTSAPGMIYAYQKGILKKQFPDTAFVFKRTRGNADNPMTDLTDFTEAMALSESDFVYADASSMLEVLNYGGGKSGPPPYVVIAGATSRNRVLMSMSAVSSLKDLAGKTVGIYNKSHDTEMLLNKELEKVGLETESLGGKVKVKYGPHDALMRDFEKGTIDAFFIHPYDYPELTKKGARVLEDGLGYFGGRTPSTLLVVRTAFLQKYPDFVREYLGVHVDSSESAMKDMNAFIDVAYDFEEQDFERESLLRKFTGAGSSTVAATYDPNLDYLQETYTFLADAKYLRLLPPLRQTVNLSVLDDVLRSKGLKEVSQAE